jgi:hypothetical protein
MNRRWLPVLLVLLLLVPAAPAVTLVGAGDIADCGRPPEATADLIAGIAGTVFTTGDNAYPDGSTRDFTQCYGPTWGRFKGRTRPSPGNHDYHQPNAAPYFAYFGANAGPRGRGYYAYNHGDWRVYSLNSVVISRAQLTWLRRDLAAHPTTCAAAYWHHPLFSSGRHGNDVRVKPFWEALYSAGVDLIINGHDHDYERFGLQNPNGQADSAFGIREMIVGTGGAGLRPFTSVEPNSRVRNSSSFGVLKLTLTATGYTGAFRPATGNFTDSFSGTCHGQPGEPPPSHAFTLSARVVSGDAQLDWTNVTGAGSYRIRRASGSGSFRTIATVTRRTFTDATVQSGKTYRYLVWAQWGGSTKFKSNTVIAKP